MAVNKKCKVCNTTQVIEIKPNDYEKFIEGVHIQHAAPYLSADEREILISGVCGKCFDSMFIEEGDDG